MVTDGIEIGRHLVVVGNGELTDVSDFVDFLALLHHGFHVLGDEVGVFIDFLDEVNVVSVRLFTFSGSENAN